MAKHDLARHKKRNGLLLSFWQKIILHNFSILFLITIGALLNRLCLFSQIMNSYSRYCYPIYIDILVINNLSMFTLQNKDMFGMCLGILQIPFALRQISTGKLYIKLT